jgi:pyrroloquinoline quinone (PQQ) biosynthesis protein C
VAIVLGDRPERLKRWCGDVQVAAELHHPLTAVWENGPVLVCRQPRMTLKELWPHVKNWD